MNDKKDFEAALKGKKVPLLVLDQKWHRLFAIHGKTDEISIPLILIVCIISICIIGIKNHRIVIFNIKKI